MAQDEVAYLAGKRMESPQAFKFAERPSPLPEHPQMSERYFELATKLYTHEAQCTERYSGIQDRLDRIETGITKINSYGAFLGFSLICGMAGLIITLLLQ